MERDLDIEKILDKMRSLRTKRDLEFLKENLDNIDIDSNYPKKIPDNKTINVKYLGKIQWKETLDGEDIDFEKEIYLLIEQIEKDGELIEIEKYYDEDFKLLGGNNKSDNFDYLLLTEDFKDREGLLEKLQTLDKEGILDLNELEQERLEEIAKALGIDIKDIKNIDEIDPEQLVEKQENEQVSEEQVEGLNIKEETVVSTYLKGETLSTKLGLEKKGITDVTKIARVTSTSLNKVSNKKSINMDSFVAIKSTGEAVILGEEILQYDNNLGTNPEENQVTVNNDGDVKKEQITSSYRIVNGNGYEYLQVGYDESSGKEIKYSQKSRTNNQFMSVELETQRTLPRDSNVRNFLNDRNAGMYEVNDVLEKNEKYEDCSEKDVTLIDNDKDNDSHEHFELDEKYISNIAREILQDEEISSVYNISDIKCILKKEIEKQGIQNISIIKKKIIEYMREKSKYEIIPEPKREK